MKLPGARASNAPLIVKLGYDKAASDVMNTRGDVAVGKALFTRQGCVACHTVDKSEPPKGPFLGDVGARYSRAEIAESVLKPSAKIAQGFTGQYFLDKKGNRTDGFVTRESGDEVEVRTVAGTAQVIKLADVKRRGELKESIMPTALADQLTVEEFGSLVSYLEGLKGK
jgi:putative heme-binding domain-containing protein